MIWAWFIVGMALGVLTHQLYLVHMRVRELEGRVAWLNSKEAERDRIRKNKALARARAKSVERAKFVRRLSALGIPPSSFRFDSGVTHADGMTTTYSGPAEGVSIEPNALEADMYANIDIEGQREVGDEQRRP